MKIKLKKTNEYTIELKIDIPWDTIEPQFNKTLKKFSKKIKMPGFRSGKIPRDRLLNQFQANIEAEFMEQNFQKYYLFEQPSRILLHILSWQLQGLCFQL